VTLEAQASHLGGPRSWVHHDVRSDNLLFRGTATPLLIDFPYLAYGPTLMDVAFFLPSVTGEGGPSPGEGLRLYEQISDHRFEAREVAVSVATVAGFFAARAGQQDIPGLPRLRWVQKLQLCPSLAWLSELLGIGGPPAPKPF
jgi:aminoglycoside phosphotransferase (APT) family kinase protein